MIRQCVQSDVNDLFNIQMNEPYIKQQTKKDIIRNIDKGHVYGFWIDGVLSCTLSMKFLIKFRLMHKYRRIFLFPNASGILWKIYF